LTQTLIFYIYENCFVCIENSTYILYKKIKKLKFKVMILKYHIPTYAQKKILNFKWDKHY